MSIRVRYALTTGGLLLVLVFAALLVYSGVTLGQVGGAAAGSGVVGGSATAGGIGAVGGVGIAAGTAVAIEAMRTLGAVLGPRLGVASSADAVRRLTTAVGALTEVVRAQQQRIDEMHLIVTQRDDEGRPKQEVKHGETGVLQQADIDPDGVASGDKQGSEGR